MVPAPIIYDRDTAMLERTIAAPVLAGTVGAAVLAFSAPDELRFAVDEGTTITKTFVTELRATLEDFSVSIDGEVRDDIPEPEFSLDDTTRVVLTDEYRAVDGGRVRTLVRTFDELNDSTTRSRVDPAGQESDETSEGESALEGLDVEFEWNEDAEEYEASFVEDDAGDGDLLEGLVAGVDFREFLPDGDVEEGETWEVDATAFEAIINPSGEVKIRSEDEEDNSELQEQMRDNVSGTIEATYVGREDGVATIELVIEVETSAIDDSPGGAPEGVEATQELAISYECEGELLWDVERGVAKSLELSGEVEIEIVGNQSAEGGPEIVIEQTLRGEIEVEVTFE